MQARLIYRAKELFPDGAIAEIVIWKLPAVDTERPHGLKYRLFYGKGRRRIVGYDNERGKGDHRHLHGTERPYQFTNVGRLLSDFWADVDRIRSES